MTNVGDVVNFGSTLGYMVLERVDSLPRHYFRRVPISHCSNHRWCHHAFQVIKVGDSWTTQTDGLICLQYSTKVRVVAIEDEFNPNPKINQEILNRLNQIKGFLNAAKRRKAALQCKNFR